MDFTTAPTNTPPDAIAPDFGAANNAAPVAIAPDLAASPTAGAPVVIAPDFGAPSNVPPAGFDTGFTAPANDPAVPVAPPIGGDGTPGLPSMPASFTPAFIELTGAGPSLATLTANAADAAAGRIVQGTVNGELRSYQVRAGADVQALPGIVRPANFDADTNAVVFVSL